MAQKIIKIGSSIGITIPKELLREIGLKAGQTVKVRAEGSERLVVEKLERPSLDQTRETIGWATDYVEKYRKDFEALADK
jgi:antitoxin component of MazEF toxin-antitoxin module